MSKNLYDLREMLCEELDEYNRDAKNGLNERVDDRHARGGLSGERMVRGSRSRLTTSVTLRLGPRARASPQPLHRTDRYRTPMMTPCECQIASSRRVCSAPRRTSRIAAAGAAWQPELARSGRC